LHFQTVEKWANLRLTLNVQKPKMLQLHRGFAPLTLLTRGSAPGHRWGVWRQTPQRCGVIGSRYRACHEAVHLRCCRLEPPLPIAGKRLGHSPYYMI